MYSFVYNHFKSYNKIYEEKKVVFCIKHSLKQPRMTVLTENDWYIIKISFILLHGPKFHFGSSRVVLRCATAELKCHGCIVELPLLTFSSPEPSHSLSLTNPIGWQWKTSTLRMLINSGPATISFPEFTILLVCAKTRGLYWPKRSRALGMKLVWPEVSSLGAYQKDCALWGQEWLTSYYTGTPLWAPDWNNALRLPGSLG